MKQSNFKSPEPSVKILSLAKPQSKLKKKNIKKRKGSLKSKKGQAGYYEGAEEQKISNCDSESNIASPFSCEKNSVPQTQN